MLVEGAMACVDDAGVDRVVGGVANGEDTTAVGMTSRTLLVAKEVMPADEVVLQKPVLWGGAEIAAIAIEDAGPTSIRVGVVEATGDEIARVVAAWAFAGGDTIVGLGVIHAGNTDGPETMSNTCSTHAICRS